MKCYTGAGRERPEHFGFLAGLRPVGPHLRAGSSSSAAAVAAMPAIPPQAHTHKHMQRG